MSHPSVFMYWNSVTRGTLLVFEDQKATIPLDLTGMVLLWLGKKRFTDLDVDAVFSLTLGSGLTLDDTPENNQLSFVIPPAATLELPRTKNTTLWVELFADPDDPELRQTLDQRELPVKPSIKEATE